MAKQQMTDADTLKVLVVKLAELEHSLRCNIPKPAVLQIVTKLRRTAADRHDYTRY